MIYNVLSYLFGVTTVNNYFLVEVTFKWLQSHPNGV